MRSHWRPILWLSFLLASGYATAGSFTLDQIMSVPFPSSMLASPSGERLVWVMNEKGARNIWYAEGPEWSGRRLTNWTDDDGLTISQIHWAPDDSGILFVRGDGANRRGELPNPLHRPEGVSQSIWWLTTDGQQREITEGTSPQLSKDGSFMVFTRRGQIWKTALDEEAKPEHWVKARGGASSLTWSPGGSHLAFVSNRGDHSFIGVFDVSAGRLHYLSPSVDRDSNPAWSPDGGSIAFMRIPATTSGPIFTPERAANPWSIMVADISTGKAREVWKADPGPGSAFRNIVASNQIFWSDDGFVVFPWEKDGWTHLYSIPASGGAAKLLTPGHFEVEEVRLDRTRRALVYNSNQGDIDRRHVWTVAASGSSRPVALTDGNSNEWAHSPLSNGHYGMLQSTGRLPARPVVRTPDGATRELASSSMPGDFPVQDLVEPEQVIFHSADGMPIHGQLFKPAGEASSPRPAMLYFHGGSRRQMLLGWHYSNYYHNCYAMNQYMANQGYVVMSVNYRSGIGYGMEFREALNYGASGASEFNDVLGAGLYLQSRDDVDGSRIGLWGGSYGGYLTAMGLSRASHLFAAGVNVHGVWDWNKVIQGFVPSYNPLEDPDATRLAFESSPAASIDTWRSPVLLIHGDDDRNVPFSESVDLVEALRGQGVEFEQLIFPDEIHGFLLHRSWMSAFEAAADFLQRKLVEKKMVH